MVDVAVLPEENYGYAVVNAVRNRQWLPRQHDGHVGLLRLGVRVLGVLSSQKGVVLEEIGFRKTLYLLRVIEAVVETKEFGYGRPSDRLLGRRLEREHESSTRYALQTPLLVERRQGIPRFILP